MKGRNERERGIERENLEYTKERRKGGIMKDKKKKRKIIINV